MAMLEPVQRRYAEYRSNQDYLNAVMAKGAEAASEHAAITLRKVYDVIGFVPRP